MIVRILGEPQREVGESDVARLNELDRTVRAAVDAGDEAAFAEALMALHAELREVGRPFEAEQLGASDLVLPPVGARIEDVLELIDDDGLIEG